MDITTITDRYVALWNEPDPDRRRAAVRELFAPAGRQVLLPPAEYRATAEALGFPAATLEVRGHDDLEVRVRRAYEDFVAPCAHRFVLGAEPVRLQDAVTFTWDMVPSAGGAPAGSGREFLLLDETGRIAVDYQFIGT